MRCYKSYILWEAFNQATVSHGLNAQQMDNLPHGHVLFRHMADPRDVALTWTQSTGQIVIHILFNLTFNNFVSLYQ